MVDFGICPAAGGVLPKHFLCQSRRPFRLPMRTLCIALLLGITTATAAELPHGSAPPAVPVDHFPSRLHAVVWRNWQLVSVDRLAKVLGATPEQIQTLATSMGLPPAGEVSPQWRRRGYITVLRRNWHLLPYEQLLPLLDMTEQELAFALREDDFLYIKLGSLKPQCEPVVWAEPDAAAQARAAEIRKVVAQQFGDAIDRAGEPRFAFIDQLSDPRRAPAPPTDAEARIGRGLRFIYSYFGTFGDPLLDETLDPYPDGLLAHLADNGVNGVWLHVVLRQLAPGGPVFPEFGADHEKRLHNLQRLVERAQQYGIAVYLYVNEPRAMPHAFFANRPELAGARSGNYRAMCTGDERVRAWLSDSLAHVFTKVPDLGGVFTITASENFTYCGSHNRQADCPRCKGRTQAQLAAEVNAAIEQGVHRGNPDARVLCWDWGWNGHGDGSEHIAALPQNTWLMSVSEWSLPIERGGVKATVGEYSISAVGPGPRAQQHWQLAQQRGLKTAAKVQLSTTWELSAVPYLPVMELVAKHCQNLAKAKLDGVMLSWSLGGYPSPNLRIAQAFADEPAANREDVLDAVAKQVYGEPAAQQVREAWRRFSNAFAEYPYHGAVLYKGPQQYGSMNLLYLEPTNYRATMIGFPYDDVNSWRGPYPPRVLAEQWEKVASGWRIGLESLRQAAKSSPAAKRELPMTEAVMWHMQSAANQVRFVLAREAGDVAALRRLAEAERVAARRMFDLAHSDSRIGFEASNHYYYVPLDFAEKVLNCQHVLDEIDRRDAETQK